MNPKFIFLLIVIKIERKPLRFPKESMPGRNSKNNVRKKLTNFLHSRLYWEYCCVEHIKVFDLSVKWFFSYLARQLQ